MRARMAPSLLRNVDLYVTVNAMIPSSYEAYADPNLLISCTSTIGSEV
jgi:hypothetical protein